MTTTLKPCQFCGSQAHNVDTQKGADRRAGNSNIHIRPALDAPQFELLMRRFATAPSGEKRAHAKEAVLLFIFSALDKPAPTDMTATHQPPSRPVPRVRGKHDNRSTP